MKNIDFINTALIEVEICMGSSCFSRGTNEILFALQSYLSSQRLEKVVRLKGTLCQSKCQNGPCIRIQEQKYDHVNPGVALDLLKHHLENKICTGD